MPRYNVYYLNGNHVVGGTLGVLVAHRESLAEAEAIADGFKKVGNPKPKPYYIHKCVCWHTTPEKHLEVAGFDVELFSKHRSYAEAQDALSKL